MMRKALTAGVLVFWTVLWAAIVWGEEPSVADAATPFRIEGAGSGRAVEVHLVAEETEQEIADGVRYQVWTYNGTAPGPVIRVKLGDTVRFTLENRTTHQLSHSIDFHAAQTPWDQNYQPVDPGQTLTFDWVARFPGVFMYHCGVPPVLMHIANGMYGAIIVEPEGLEPAREYVMVSSEFYPGTAKERGALTGDLTRMNEVDPEYVVFDGGFDRYAAAPLVARPNELIRLWVVNAGPTLENAFHVIGALFDHAYPSGNPTTPENGVQTYGIPPGDGAMFELRIPDAGMYPFVTHAFAYTGLGSVGVIQVDPTAPLAPESYPMLADPFSAGVLPAGAAAPGTGSAPTSQSPSPSHEVSHGGGAIPVDTTITGFDPDVIEVPAGPVALEFRNADAFPHDFTIDELDVKVAIDASANAVGTFTVEEGTYEFYCSIPGHRESGMVGTLVVG
jgi:nitrite reductase (NO-forming)